MTSTASSLAARIVDVQDRIARAADRSGRAADTVTLVAVSKTVGRAQVDDAYALGIRHFGENRVQDAMPKFEDAPEDAHLHLIGSLQTNKVRQVVGHTYLIHSVDRLGLIEALQARCSSHDVIQPILLQVNIAAEEQKHGCAPEEVAELIEAALASSHLRLRGLMTMAPLVGDADVTRPVFVGLRELRDQLRTAYPEANLSDLSMGMTNDFEVAIEEGATIVRVGRAIFAPEQAS